MAPDPELPKALTGEQLFDIQGDVWSKGFPKYYETYYFFTIKQAKQFARCLPALTTGTQGHLPLISNLKTVKECRIGFEGQGGHVLGLPVVGADPNRKIVFDIANALIAFTYQGLEAASPSRFGIGSMALILL
jgi:hypothetical protein